MAHQLKLAVDGVVDANHIFTDIGRLRDGRNVLTGAQVRLREGTRIQLEDRVWIDQVGGDDGDSAAVTKGLARSQAVGCVERQFCRVTGFWHYRDGVGAGNVIG